MKNVEEMMGVIMVMVDWHVAPPLLLFLNCRNRPTIQRLHGIKDKDHRDSVDVEEQEEVVAAPVVQPLKIHSCSIVLFSFWPIFFSSGCTNVRQILVVPFYVFEDVE